MATKNEMHSPIDWRIQHDRLGEVVIDQNYYPVARMVGLNHKANASFIARAVNAHADLLAALNEIVNLPADDDGSRTIPAGFLDIACAAIARAENSAEGR